VKEAVTGGEPERTTVSEDLKKDLFPPGPPPAGVSKSKAPPADAPFKEPDVSKPSQHKPMADEPALQHRPAPASAAQNK
jgi:hypothetical protein